MTKFYLIINSRNQPLYNKKTGQLFIYNSMEEALRKLQKDFIKDRLAKRIREVITIQMMMEL